VTIAEAWSLICPELDRISVFVDIAMVQSTQEQPMRTSGVRTRRVALVQRALERTGDRAALASNRQRRAVFALDDLDHAGVTAEPARGFNGYEGLAHLAYLDGIGHAGAQAALWNGEREVDRRAIGPIAA
jgi:hypothetical protein